MSRIILIETATARCSAAICEDGKTICSRSTDEPRAHASKTALFISEMLEELKLKASDCDAVALSCGPGSYTGLRVGSSTAKGICFGAGIPLIAINTTDVIASQAISQGLVPQGCKNIFSMIDARRMEAYCRQYDASGNPTGEIEAKVIDGESFEDFLKEGICLFVGDGALKCKDVIRCENARFAHLLPEASAMAPLATKAFEEGRFENTAYFEPFYLKDFVATVSKKKLF